MSVRCEIRGHCPKCGPSRRAHIRGEHETKEVDEYSDGYVLELSTRYRILECAGCESVYCQRTEESYDTSVPDDYQEADQITYWPSTVNWKPPDWQTGIRDVTLRRILNEVYKAFNGDMPVLTAIGVRTAFDRASELLGIESDMPFKRKLVNLKEGGFISNNDHDALAALVDAGSAAAHRSWRPSDKDLKTMVQILESFVHKEIVLSQDIGGLTSSIPPR